MSERTETVASFYDSADVRAMTPASRRQRSLGIGRKARGGASNTLLRDARLADAAPMSDPRATIVIADDDITTSFVLGQILTRQNFRVIAVENGKLACEAVRREQPAVVVLDWLMPVMDGREALIELKSDSATRGIPVVMLTSYADVNERIIALEAGAQDFLSKPFDPRELVASIEQQLRWREHLAVDADNAFLAERAALRAASERRYRLQAEAMPHIVWIAEPHGSVRYFNRAWYEYTGSTVERSITSDWAFAVHSADRKATLSAWAVSLASGTPFEHQCRVRRASDGCYRWNLVRAVPTTDESGAIAEWVGSCADIHDYKIASETRTVLDTMGSIVAIRSSDGFVDYASPYWSQYTGSSIGAALGFGWRDFVHADDLAIVDQNRAESNGAQAGTRNFEMRIRGRDGVYRTFLSQTTMLPDAPDMPRRWLDTSTDIDDLKRSQSALANSESRYRALTDSMPQMVWVCDATGNIEYVNHRWSEYTGSDISTARADGSAAVVHGDDLAAVAAMHTSPGPFEYACEARFRRYDGEFRWHAVRAVAFSEVTDGSQKWIGTATDIEESKAAAAALATTAAELEHLAHHDAMTNLPNRMLLVERLTQAIAFAKRARSEVIVLYVDLDRFKLINDTRGHAAGDRVLAVTSERIVEALRAGDTASRVGGDEFVLVCATSEAAEDAARLANRLLDAIGAPIDLDGDFVSVGASIGISMYPGDSTAGDELIRKADSAMYSAKQSGRNMFRIYREETHSSIVAALEFEMELNTALALHQFVVHYQPTISLLTNQLIGAEALVRWQHPHRGLLQPGEFLAFAEAHRMIGEIGAFVRDAVCAQIAALPADLSPDFHISMNVSATQLMQPGWVAGLATALAEHHAEPRRLQIEVAERIALNDPVAVAAILADLRELGVSLSIDDFGTGHSSLATIKSFPLHTLKIDRSFVQDIVTNSGDQAVAKAIITLAHSLGLSVIAAGVETEEQVEALRAFGSDGFQGYLASRPMAAGQFTTFLTTHRQPTLSAA